ncbi:MAG: hypothetical protein AB1715_11755, partial [Acidobacteriota bacterium]
MKIEMARGLAALVVILMTLSSAATPGQDLSLKDIMQKNIDASGGKEKIGQVHNLSFRTGNTLSVIASTGELKLSTGKDPVVTEVILVQGGQTRKNSYGAVTDIPNPQKAVYLTLARLYAGLFSLVKFEGELQLAGLKAFGPEKLYQLTTRSGGLAVDFFLRPEDFRLKRLLFRGSTPEGEKFESNYDFGPFEAADGVTIPLSWFSSQVGGARGTLSEVTDLKLNQPLPKDYFSRLEVNVGTTEASPGLLKGNVIDFDFSPFGLTINTNLRKNHVEKAELRTGDKLTFLVEGVESELVFYASAAEVPTRSELA